MLYFKAIILFSVFYACWSSKILLARQNILDSIKQCLILADSFRAWEQLQTWKTSVESRFYLKECLISLNAKRLYDEKQRLNELKEENENKIYRSRLASRINSAILRDFLPMRYRKFSNKDFM